MKYLLLMYADESIISNYSKEEFQAAAGTWTELVREMTAAEVLISNRGLAPVCVVSRRYGYVAWRCAGCQCNDRPDPK